MKPLEMAKAGLGTVAGVLVAIGGFLVMVVVGGLIIYGFQLALAAVWAILSGQAN